HMMTGSARDSVARERPVFRVPIVKHLAREELVGFIAMIDMELALSQHCMATETKILDKCRSTAMPVQMPMYGGFGVELCEENRVAARETHHRVTPFAILREIAGNIRAVSEDHVRDCARERSARIMAPGALIRGDKLLRTSLAGGVHRHMIISLGHHARDF